MNENAQPSQPTGGSESKDQATKLLPPEESAPSPAINTYHCICLNLLFATTLDVSSLPTRRSPSLDHALILPISSPLTETYENASDSEPEKSESTIEDPASDNPHAKKPAKRRRRSSQGQTLLLSLSPDRKPVVVRREDGFEKRQVFRCLRCRLLVGYHLLDAPNPEIWLPSSQGAAKAEGESLSKSKERPKPKVFYLLPGGFMSTETMMARKVLTERDISLVTEGGV
ncbi:MAG: hypothetical protein M1829_000966 [Trizodia sp. TS-e1964]|nr:MAG: hypothetical protein M1829_000966 [Trizodia sp. TS-e1964]